MVYIWINSNRLNFEDMKKVILVSMIFLLPCIVFAQKTNAERDFNRETDERAYNKYGNNYYVLSFWLWGRENNSSQDKWLKIELFYGPNEYDKAVKGKEIVESTGRRVIGITPVGSVSDNSRNSYNNSDYSDDAKAIVAYGQNEGYNELRNRNSLENIESSYISSAGSSFTKATAMSSELLVGVVGKLFNKGRVNPPNVQTTIDPNIKDYEACQLIVGMTIGSAIVWDTIQCANKKDCIRERDRRIQEYEKNGLTKSINDLPNSVSAFEQETQTKERAAMGGISMRQNNPTQSQFQLSYRIAKAPSQKQASTNEQKQLIPQVQENSTLQPKTQPQTPLTQPIDPQKENKTMGAVGGRQ